MKAGLSSTRTKLLVGFVVALMILTAAVTVSRSIAYHEEKVFTAQGWTLVFAHTSRAANNQATLVGLMVRFVGTDGRWKEAKLQALPDGKFAVQRQASDERG